MAKDRINVTLDRDLWDGLSKVAHEQSILKGKRFTTIQALRTSIHVFLRMEPQEINEIIKRDARKIG